MEQAAGLEHGQRYRCAACGNLTRFDVESTERVRRFWHVDLAGTGVAEEEQRLRVRVESVTCRWCGSSEDIEIIDALTRDSTAVVATDAPDPDDRTSPKCHKLSPRPEVESAGGS